MGLLTCGCLNVKIYIKNSDLKQVDLNSLEGASSSEEFFTLKISSAHLNLEGVIVEHWCLVKKKICGIWSLHRCVNCDTWTHALNNAQGTSLILVNMTLQKEETTVSSLEKCVDFSTLYKVVLTDKNDNQPIQTLGVQSEKYESLQQTLTTIQQQLNKFLVNEESAMEKRIREYEETQRTAFAKLQQKARQDKNNLIRMILSAEDKDEVDCASSQLDNVIQPPKQLKVQHTMPTHPKAVKKTIGFAVEKDALVTTPVIQSNTDTVKAASATVKSFSRSASALSSRIGNNNAAEKEMEGQLFDMDPTFPDDEISNRPFYNSDDEENEDTDDSELDSPSVYSTSVPISVPAWKMQRKSKHRALEEEDESPPDPDNIAASIKALARSVHNDEAQIFGGLPRKPRPRGTPVYGSSVM